MRKTKKAAVIILAMFCVVLVVLQSLSVGAAAYYQPVTVTKKLYMNDGTYKYTNSYKLSYNSNGYISKEIYKNGGTGATFETTYSYSYKSNGIRKSATAKESTYGTSSLTYNARGYLSSGSYRYYSDGKRCTHSLDGTVNYYNNNGYLTARINGNGQVYTYSYTFNSVGQPTRILCYRYNVVVEDITITYNSKKTSCQKFLNALMDVYL